MRKCGLRALAQSMARELAPQGMYFIIEGFTDKARSRRWAPDNVRHEDELIATEALAEVYLQTHAQPRNC